MASRHAFGVSFSGFTCSCSRNDILLQYSKSIRAKCHGPPPCKARRGTGLPVGTLRYGLTISNQYGENVEWRHWGCVTPNILQWLATVNLNDVSGFIELSPADQKKVRLAVQMRRIDPADVPESAKSKHKPSVSGVQTSQKRKATEDLPSSSTPRVTSAQPPVASQVVEVIDDESPEDEVVDELYTMYHTNVVGIQYYTGLVGPGEEVVLVREPRNRFDANAIQVKNIGQDQVGHIPRAVAAKLAPLLDRNSITVEGVINDGNLGRSNAYTLSLTLRIYVVADTLDVLEPQLVWATPSQRGGAALYRAPTPAYAYGSPAVQQTPSISTAQQEAMRKHQEAILKQQALRKAAELKQMIDGLEKVNDEGRRGSLLDTLCSTEDILNLPLHPDPPGTQKGNLQVDLLKHQSQALQWCIEREHPVLPTKESDKPVQFWQYKTANGKQPYYFNLATNTPQTQPPVLGRGALCADVMGLGKTLTMLSLIIATKGDESPTTSKTTLIVSPLSILSNWEKQVEGHCAPGAISACVYYGSNRNMSVEELKSYDVVITTYQTITSEYGSLDAGGGNGFGTKKKRKSEQVLFSMDWKRVILDEGHNIRNPKTKMAKSVCALKGERRWVLSGTPIINSPRDLGSLLTFLRICKPLDNEDFFKRLLLRPLKDALPSGIGLLSALMSQICIRRTKEMQDSQGNPLIPLPPVEMIKVPVTLDDETRQLYDQVEQASRQRFRDYMNNRAVTTFAQSNVLGMLTRMRQLVLHPGLIHSSYLEELRKGDSDSHAEDLITSLKPEEKLHLQDILAQAIEDCEECPICFGLLNNPRITYCAHKFCLACISEVISRDPKCPMVRRLVLVLGHCLLILVPIKDRRPISMNDMLEPPPLTELTQKPIRDNKPEQATGVRAGSSAKIDQLVRLLQLTPGSEKSLVFSQFTSFLDKIEEALDAAGIPFVRFDGQMSARRRQEAITRFSVPVKKSENSQDDEVSDQMNPRVMLISLKAGAFGLNLTVANNVYLMDPWWQEGIESQAIDRVNRIGQKKPVHVYQLIAEDTIESKVLEIQERKKKLVQQAFSGITRRETQREQREARFQGIVEIFGARNQNEAGEE
ncbi:Putative SWI/SNF-like matrix-associated actin-dependent regulator [Leucoagaricus sp. SymC.cos]|nr:Putative SWI/SNF-like matrix-associated actin-dependent regulator [Leucoagaricus sp. SymC.cos]